MRLLTTHGGKLPKAFTARDTQALRGASLGASDSATSLSNEEAPEALNGGAGSLHFPAPSSPSFPPIEPYTPQGAAPKQAPAPVKRRVASPSTRLCHTIAPTSGAWDCMERAFCALGARNVIPAIASPELAVVCELDARGHTRAIQACSNYAIEEDVTQAWPDLLKRIEASALEACALY